MALEIKELVIKTTVNEGGSDTEPSALAEGQSRDLIIAECVEKVMELLKEKSER